jgi:hypothetical protein
MLCGYAPRRTMGNDSFKQAIDRHRRAVLASNGLGDSLAVTALRPLAKPLVDVSLEKANVILNFVLRRL